MPNPTDGSRGRLLDAAEALLREDPDRSLSVRAVCSRAGVQLPTLYHFFESKQGLIDALVERGFERFARLLDEIPSPSATGSPAAIWDAHLAFAVEHPALFALMTGHVRPGSPRGGDDIASAAVLRLLREDAAAGGLAVSADEAAWRLRTAATGAALAAIADPASCAHYAGAARDALVSAMTRSADRSSPPAAIGAHAGALQAALAGTGAQVLEPAERALLELWLARLSLPPR
ncbi:AcrR family transcriptional regulator [Microbacterium sp. SORGH_AS428]|uniref:TetR/AcrR family transcriptional regulator n=1 Tax=Microbacterium sp. SORGH_AS_0428 TaxID=3041788 RepID=UPI002866299E|nr:TetR/AcrR family transcriptional regulator [Microbacterium sp. SORGH_AS_0428]MDR6199353.1 AcrR family transcriptional regulator [Microbacterium sp. SORGH_AS_0428]